mmetsp:Transcript_109761/g.317367  ORF Transcript_109761/g.317367 Transcript_109761/m.317367 type:complete len:106 (+) Transcript_109761:112-429(+)
MGTNKQLHGTLAKMCDLEFCCLAKTFVFDRIHVDTSVVSEVEEHIVCLDGFRTLLLATEDQIYPVRKHGRTNITFKSRSHDLNELLWRALCPGRENNVTKNLAIL